MFIDKYIKRIGADFPGYNRYYDWLVRASKTNDICTGRMILRNLMTKIGKNHPELNSIADKWKRAHNETI